MIVWFWLYSHVVLETGLVNIIVTFAAVTFDSGSGKVVEAEDCAQTADAPSRRAAVADSIVVGSVSEMRVGCLG